MTISHLILGTQPPRSGSARSALSRRGAALHSAAAERLCAAPRSGLAQPRVLCAETLGWGASQVVAAVVIDAASSAQPPKLFVYRCAELS